MGPTPPPPPPHPTPWVMLGMLGSAPEEVFRPFCLGISGRGVGGWLFNSPPWGCGGCDVTREQQSKSRCCVRNVWGHGLLVVPFSGAQVVSVIWGRGTVFYGYRSLCCHPLSPILVLWRWRWGNCLTTGTFTTQRSLRVSSCGARAQHLCQGNRRCLCRQIQCLHHSSRKGTGLGGKGMENYRDLSSRIPNGKTSSAGQIMTL